MQRVGTGSFWSSWRSRKSDYEVYTQLEVQALLLLPLPVLLVVAGKLLYLHAGIQCTQIIHFTHARGMGACSDVRSQSHTHTHA